MASMPTGSNLEAFLYGAGLISNPQTSEEVWRDYDGAIDAAARKWERETGFTPFEATQADTTVYLNPQTRDDFRNNQPMGAFAFLGETLLTGDRQMFIPPQLGTGIVSLTSLTVSSSTQTLNRDYWLEPNNAPLKKRPYTILRFLMSPISSRLQIVMVGKFGFCAYDAVPNDVRRAIMQMAAIEMLPEIIASTTGGLKRWMVGQHIMEEYGDKPFGATIDAWQKNISETMNRYSTPYKMA